MIFRMTQQLRDVDSAQISGMSAALSRTGVRMVLGTVVNAAGITLAKSVPLSQLAAFHRAGMGASPVFQVFCIDAAIAFTDSITAVGDMRLRLDLDAVRDLGDGVAWGPANLYSQAGEALAGCPRGLLGRVERRLAEAGLAALVGHEVEFVLVAADGSALGDTTWVPYGATGLLDREALLSDMVTAADTAGLQIEQLHAEYGRNQFEISLAPASPVMAADAAVLTKLLVGRVARRHHVRASFSPVPFPGSVGNGAHQHVSLTRGGTPLLSGGEGPHGVTADGGAGIGGLLRGLPEIQGLLTGSLLSGERIKPGLWSGAQFGWGLENREAAVRFIQAGPGTPHGANVEVKIIDPSANVYVASAALLALALEGIATGEPVPGEFAADPSTLTDARRRDAGATLLPDSVATIIDTLDASPLARRLVGDEIVDATVATRRYEQNTHAAKPVQQRADQFRLSWTI